MGNIIKNTYKGWVTTLIGSIFIAGGMFSVLREGSTVSWTEAMVVIVPGILLIFCPDKLFKKLTGSLNDK